MIEAKTQSISRNKESNRLDSSKIVIMRVNSSLRTNNMAQFIQAKQRKKRLLITGDL
jgi:hypothetical protein